jgi:hypothetical protein
MRVKLLQLVERVLSCLAEWAENARQRCAVCPDCGRNRYSGPPCVNNSPHTEAEMRDDARYN